MECKRDSCQNELQGRQRDYCGDRCRKAHKRAQETLQDGSGSTNADKAGYVYVIRFGDTSYYKIGHTASGPIDRMRRLQAGSPVELTVCEVFYVADVMGMERAAHDLMREFRVRGEWFELNEQRLDKLMLLLAEDVHVFYDEAERDKAKAEYGRRVLRTLADYDTNEILFNDSPGDYGYNGT